MDEAFFRDFFRMPPKAEKKATSAPEPRSITINCQTTDPLEIRAANIVTMLGFQGGGGAFSIPSINPAEATLRVLKVLRKYEEQDSEK